MLFKKTQTDTSNKTIKHQNAKHKIILIILAALLVNFASAQQPTLLSLQGKLTNTSTGAKILSADLRVNITDSSKSLIFNHSFSNAVSNGMFDLLLGSTYYLNLSYNEDYNLSLYVGDSDTPVGGPYWFRGGQGQIGAGDIATTESYIFGNVSVIGNISVGGNLSVDTNVLFVDAENDRVGIGTTSPEVALEVEGSVNISGGLNVTAGNVLLATTSGNVGIGTSSPTHELHVVGDVNITNNLYLGQNLTDLAENIFAEDDARPGDVVVISDGMKVRKSYKAYDKKAVGVISTEPAAVFGGNKGDVELAISGRVPVKAINENGAIEPGDLLTTSSTKGHAMKCSSFEKCFGNIIGKALEPLEEETGVIEMIIMLN